jgi:hypothetical protein
LSLPHSGEVAQEVQGWWSGLQAESFGSQEQVWPAQ